jgi:copper(I)-binding protein
VFVFDNDYPALLGDPARAGPDAEASAGSTLLRAAPVRGRCRVLCYSPRHDLSLAEMTDSGREQVVDAWIRETPPGRTVSAGYLTLDNAGAEPLMLVEASSDQAGRIEFHTHSHVDGMMRMRRVTEVEVPAGGSVTFAPGGLHLMLFETQSPREGAALDVVLKTAFGDRLEVVFPVRRSAPAPVGTEAGPQGGST